MSHITYGFRRSKISLGIHRALHRDDVSIDDPNLWFKQGDIITCPECGAYIAKATQNVKRHSGKLLRSRDFILLVPKSVAPGKECICPVDQVPFMRDGMVHTARGWV